MYNNSIIVSTLQRTLVQIKFNYFNFILSVLYKFSQYFFQTVKICKGDEIKKSHLNEKIVFYQPSLFRDETNYENLSFP